jgi:hypothetical protein
VGGNGVLFFATGKKIKNKLLKFSNLACQPYLRISPLKLPFLVTLEPPRFTKGQFPPKIPRPAGQTKF